ncbi:MAG: ribonuclease P protein component [Tannerella sp.]|jgi:ribonuclease P protein component|nr:ribonuclease P protein component [Tannerella sp.]
MTEDAERKFFPKSERLFLKKDIDRLFNSGQSFISYPLRVVYLSDVGDNSSQSGISVLVSVPKKRIKRAVKRNRIKRLIRETFRLNKRVIIPHYRLNGKYLHIAFMYVCNEVLSCTDIEKAMLKALKNICIKENKGE